MSWRRILLLSLLLLVAIAAGTWFVLHRTGAATGLVRSALRSLLAGEFALQRADVDLFAGSLTLHELTVADPTRPGQTLLRVERANIAVETDPLGDLLAVHELAVDGLLLDLDLTPGHTPDPARLLKARGGDATPDRVIPVALRGGLVRVRFDADLPPLEFRDLELQLQRAHDPDGAPDATRGVLDGSARLSALDLPVRLRGDIDLQNGCCRVQAAIDDVLIDGAVLQRLQPYVNLELPQDGVAGRVRQLRLLLELPLHGGDATAGAAFEIEQLDCTLPPLPAPVHGARVHGVVDTRQDGTVRLVATDVLPGAETEIVARVAGLFGTPAVEVRAKARGLPIDATTIAVLNSFPAGERVVDALRPTAGLADLDLFLRDPGRDDEIVDLDLSLRGVALAYHGFGMRRRVSFPLPVVDASGRVHLRDDLIDIEDVVASIAPEAGGGSITMSGRVDTSRDSDLLRIDLQAPRVVFTPALRSAFAALLEDDGELYDQFAPQGAAAVTLRVRGESDPGGPWHVEVRPLGATAAWRRFPLPLDDVRGVVVAHEDGVRIDLTAGNGPGRATIQGSLATPDGDDGRMRLGRLELAVAATGVAIDEPLRHAATTLSPRLQVVWDELAPHGALDANLRLCRSEGEAPFVYDLDLDVRDGRLLPRSLPMPIATLHGRVNVHGRDDDVEVTFDALRGLVQESGGAGAELAVVGTIVTAPDYRETLTAVVRDLRLDAELGSVLEASGALGKGAWAIMRPSGTVDLISHHVRTGGNEPEHSFEVLLRDVRSDAEMLPRPASSITGELRIAGGEVRFRDVRARLGNALVTCSDGRVGPAGSDRTEVFVRVGAERFPLDDTFANLFVGPLRQAVLDRQPRGALNVNGLELRFLLPADGNGPIETVLRGQVEALDVELLLGTRLQSVNGIVTLDESHVTRDGGSLQGSITRGSLRLVGHPVLGISGRFHADPRRFVLDEMEASVHGGAVQGIPGVAEPLVYEFGPGPGVPGTLATDLQLRGISLREFLHACGMQNTPYHGTVRGEVRLRNLRGDDLVDMQADGNLEIVDANLGTVPIFTAIYQLMSEQQRPRFEGLSVQFAIRDRALHLNDLVLRSPLVAVQGGGTLTMEGYLDVVLTTDTLFGGSADLLLLPPVVQMITSNLVRFHLFGHLRDLRAEQRWFTQRDPRRRPIMPMPPRIERPKRPDY